LVPGVRGLSSEGGLSYTRCATPFSTNDITVIDTPAINGLSTEKMDHNLWISQAFNHHDISSLFLVVAADVRIPSTLKDLKELLDRFEDLEDIICPIITKTDTVSWSEKEFMGFLKSELGIEKAVFTNKEIAKDELTTRLLAGCSNPRKISVDSDTFLKYFPIGDNNRKINGIIRRESTRFAKILTEFQVQLPSFPDGPKRTDLVFEFQAYMNEEIIHARRKLEGEFDWNNIGPEFENAAGHVAHLVAQLKNTLFSVRTLALEYQSRHGVAELRRCPHCGYVWGLVTGCTGLTKCGNLPSMVDIQSNRAAEYAHFLFLVTESGNEIKLSISEKAEKTTITKSQTSQGVGCGQPITWTEMAPVPVPQEFRMLPVVSVDDVTSLSEPKRETWKEYFGNKIRSIRYRS
jgi:hypothetical protein